MRDLEQSSGPYCISFHTLQQLLEPTAWSLLKLDPYCEEQKCSVWTLVFDKYVYMVCGGWRVLTLWRLSLLLINWMKFVDLTTWHVTSWFDWLPDDCRNCRPCQVRVVPAINCVTFLRCRCSVYWSIISYWRSDMSFTATIVLHLQHFAVFVVVCANAFSSADWAFHLSWSKCCLCVYVCGHLCQYGC